MRIQGESFVHCPSSIFQGYGPRWRAQQSHDYSCQSWWLNPWHSHHRERGLTHKATLIAALDFLIKCSEVLHQSEVRLFIIHSKHCTLTCCTCDNGSPIISHCETVQHNVPLVEIFLKGFQFSITTSLCLGCSCGLYSKTTDENVFKTVRKRKHRICYLTIHSFENTTLCFRALANGN